MASGRGHEKQTSLPPERFVFATHTTGVSRDHFIFKLKYNLHVLKCTGFLSCFDICVYLCYHPVQAEVIFLYLILELGVSVRCR